MKDVLCYLALYAAAEEQSLPDIIEDVLFGWVLENEEAAPPAALLPKVHPWALKRIRAQYPSSMQCMSREVR